MCLGQWDINAAEKKKPYKGMKFFLICKVFIITRSIFGRIFEIVRKIRTKLQINIETEHFAVKPFKSTTRKKLPSEQNIINGSSKNEGIQSKSYLFH